MELILYKNFSKRINSTKQPSGGTSVNVKLKAGTSVENPIFLIDGINLDVNYCKWNNHYYYVSDIILGNNNIYELHCVQDLLATYKDAITDYTGYVEYAASDYNKWIPDRRLTMSVNANYKFGEQLIVSGSSYVIAVAGKDNSGNCQVGLVCYYAVNAANLKILSDILYSDSLLDDLKKYFKDPFSCFIEAHWCPFSLAAGSDFIYLGNSSSDAKGLGLAGYVGTDSSIFSKDITIPWEYKDWRDFSPYTLLRLWLPFYGMVDIDTSLLISNGIQLTTLHIKVALDPIAGEICYGVYAGALIGTYRADCSVPLSVGQTTGKKVAGVGEILGGIGTTAVGVIGLAGSGGASGAKIAKGVATVAGGVTAIGLGAATMFAENSSAKGGTGGFAQGNLVIHNDTIGNLSYHYIYHEFSMDADDINSIEGKPLFATRKLGDLSGYVKCAGASIPIDGLASDRETINQYVNQGIYIE